MRDFLEMVATPFGGILLFFVLLVAALMWVGNHAAVAGHLADIEQLRHDAALVDPAQAEDVIGQVTETNRWLAETKVGNHQWWIGWAIPDEWDAVELIEVPHE